MGLPPAAAALSLSPAVPASAASACSRRRRRFPLASASGGRSPAPPSAPAPSSGTVAALASAGDRAGQVRAPKRCSCSGTMGAPRRPHPTGGEHVEADGTGEPPPVDPRGHGVVAYVLHPANEKIRGGIVVAGAGGGEACAGGKAAHVDGRVEGWDERRQPERLGVKSTARVQIRRGWNCHVSATSMPRGTNTESN
uniref:Uncharacterized protein n=2 Tax=Oryza sativa subsp. japonica TaxID=39947 RepID=Q7G5X8_ORYSJ|nr:hypothetical protein [Oryza sativa Japonica Group]AAP46247.1 hypothetical protein [Oryza sativa Japonica Group]ABF99711.1 hypothetical protein LOC_Os03g61610 [Oryza sativa Japonica Group]